MLLYLGNHFDGTPKSPHYYSEKCNLISKENNHCNVDFDCKPSVRYLSFLLLLLALLTVTLFENVTLKICNKYNYFKHLKSFTVYVKLSFYGIAHCKSEYMYLLKRQINKLLTSFASQSDTLCINIGVDTVRSERVKVWHTVQIKCVSNFSADK